MSDVVVLKPGAATADRTRPVRRVSSSLLVSRLWTLSLVLILAFLVLYPIAMLVAGAFTEPGAIGAYGDFTLANFVELFSEPIVYQAVYNTLFICAASTIVAVAIGLLFAWITARTDTPMIGLIEMAGIMPLFLPPLVAGIAWSFLGSPTTGLINVFLNAMGFEWRVNVYSYAGMIFVFGMYYSPYVYMFAHAALANVDASLEEAANVVGAGTLRTILTITFPLVLPAILSGGLLAFIVMMGTYGIPGALGTPARIPLLTTYMYQLVSSSPPRYNTVAAVAILLLLITATLVFVKQRLLSGRSFATIGGKGFKARRTPLGRWKWLTLSFALLYIFLVAVLPTLALAVGAFRRFMFIPDVSALFDWSQYGVAHFYSLFRNPTTMRSLVNTLELGIITIVVGGVLSFSIAYTIYRTRIAGRQTIEILSSLSVAIPSLVIGVAYLWAWIGLPGGLYGTIWILALALVARFLPDAVQSLSTSLMQIHRDLEEASWICGRGYAATIAAIVLPLSRPGLISTSTLLFILAIRELGSTLFLYTSLTMPMAMLLLQYFESGNISMTAAFCIVQIGLLLIATLGARMLSGKRI